MARPKKETYAQLEDYIAFGENLKRLMTERNMSQNTLSELTGFEQGRISDYVTHKAQPTFLTAVIIARALGCSLDEFIV